MKNNDKDQLSYIFRALSHPIRRKILKLIATYETISFKDLMNELEIKDGSTLNYHLKEMELLLDKDASLYRLSRLGMLAFKICEEFKDKLIEMHPTLTGSDIIILKPEYNRTILINSIYSLCFLAIAITILPSPINLWITLPVILITFILLFRKYGLTYIAYSNGITIKHETILGHRTKNIIGQVVLIEIKKTIFKPFKDLVVHIKRENTLYKVTLSDLNLSKDLLTKLEILWRTKISH
ncbi:MAG: helix-turn-helix domain-containing protein [archaeon GB-1867-035]|nr:helix-turn-helix domain-containing protein [Candidatus Culexmicrobium profundum]